MEIIIAIVVIAIIITFSVPKFSEINNKTHITTLKSELSLIQSGIAKQKNKDILLGKTSQITLLDEASIDKKDEKLFSNVLDFSIISTNSNEKKHGKWAKISSQNYAFYLTSGSVIFALEDGNFICKSEETICMEIQ